MKLFQRANRAAGFEDLDNVRGERGPPLVRQAASLQSRLSNILALVLMLAMGAAVLSGYYLHTASQRRQAHQQAQSASSNRAQSEMALPALAVINRPASAAGASAGPIPLASLAAPALAELPDATGMNVPAPPGAPPGTAPGAAASSLERRLSGAAFTHAALAQDGSTAANGARAELSGGPVPRDAVRSADGPPGGAVSLATLLHSESNGAAAARALPTQRLLLPKGAFIDCTLETAIDSTLPGMTTCVTASDTFGVDGNVVLLERGTKLVGETRGQVQQGTARVFVLWTEARTPTGVIVPLDSPAADELGRAGLPGNVDRHFWERFGAALFISTIDSVVQAAVQSSNRGSGTIVYNPSAAQDVTTEVLKSTLSIAPTVRKDNGDRIQIMVARDIDFTGVYALRHATAAHE